jgi:acetoin utilization deacetylase AcuC-like enzyme
VREPQLLGQRGQPLGAARDEHDVVRALRKLARELGADPGGGAGDDYGGVRFGRRKGHDEQLFPLVKVWTHHRALFPLPPQHKFPLDKYELLAERVLADGIVAPHELIEPDPIDWIDLAAVHDCGLLSRIREGCLTVREERALGLPWSRALVERGRRSVAGTVAAARHALTHDVAINLGGGTHHAGHDFARGYCLFNDVAVALAGLRRDGLADRALIVDCDVHQGDGTAQIFAADERTFTLSLHGARNYPFQRIASDLDVDIASGTGDVRYLRALAEALDFALERAHADFAFYLAGADPWEGDRLGRLALSKRGLRTRDELALDRLLATDARVCVVLAGGYAVDVRDTVEINAATVAAVAAHQPTTAPT